LGTRGQHANCHKDDRYTSQQTQAKTTCPLPGIMFIFSKISEYVVAKALNTDQDSNKEIKFTHVKKKTALE
jgi:hypothetical protein